MAQSYLFMLLPEKLFHTLFLQHVATQGLHFIGQQPGTTKTIFAKSDQVDAGALRQHQQRIIHL
jgi:hypothetical protein